ncbi:hypothetical protein NA57DRAFT_58522 [Rhizodiscina lignyota]|uniref:Zn(2)-C6 fungal-type domain-containing protein n=1 Tax=Rhizodiscina lignyota TaxID=1504668 RepID=A0A9P4ICS1_9PEZI|nr:hypothetical protein NA57DRAFT_58522 [Rhizodiscina lignyota]
MPRELSRRGCATCKSRKIKCDEQLPECGQCTRAKRKCPGAITDLIFINAAALPQVQPDGASYGKSYGGRQIAGPYDTSSAFLPPRASLSDVINNRRGMPSVQIDLAKSNQAQLLSLFIEDFSNLHVDPSQPTPWLLELPHQSCPPELEPLVRTAASSATLAFFGMITADNAIQEEARRCYGRGLSYQGRQLLRLQSKAKHWNEQRRLEYIRVLISAAMLLCSYELVLPSDTNSWFLHIAGAASLLNGLGPEACQEGFIHQIFQIVRFGVALTCFVAPKPTFLSSGDWVDIPFEKSRKTSFDKLMGILIEVPWAEIEPSTARGDDSATLEERISIVQSGITALDEWWCQHRSQYDMEYCPPRDFMDYGSSYKEVYRIGAVIVTLYNGALVKLIGILGFISPENSDPLKEKHWQHSERVLSCASFIADQPNHHAKLQVSLPTTVVAYCGATPAQRARARHILERVADDGKKGDPQTVERAAQLVQRLGRDGTAKEAF